MRLRPPPPPDIGEPQLRELEMRGEDGVRAFVSRISPAGIDMRREQESLIPMSDSYDHGHPAHYVTRAKAEAWLVWRGQVNGWWLKFGAWAAFAAAVLSAIGVVVPLLLAR